jgi:hypothetical protein
MVRPKRVLAQTMKELTQLERDRLTLALALVLPLILLLLFGFAISLDVNSINLAIQDFDQSPMSREYIPISLRWLAAFVPAQSYMPLTRDAFARGMGWSNTWTSVLTLIGLAGFFFVMTWQKLQRM